MKRLHCPLKAIITGLIILMISGAQAFADFGPLQTSNRFPLHLLFLKPRPVNAELPAKGDLEATLAMDYSNTFFDRHNNRWNVLMDMEMLVTELSLAYGLNSKVTLRLDLPFVSMGGGFLDGFLENYHDALGVSNYGRENRPKNTFAYRVSKDDRLWVQGDEDAMQIADLTLSAQIQLVKPRRHGTMDSSVLLSVKLPTGDKDRGLGSGRFDAGIYMPVRWTTSPWSFSIMPGFGLISDPETAGAHVSARNSYAMLAALGYDYSQSTTWLVQLNYYTSPIEETGLDALDKGALELAVGFHHRLAQHWLVEFAFCEDLTLAMPDFNIRLGLRRTWSVGGD